MSLNVFLPCRKGSERVPKKNVKPFAGYEKGLIEIKLKQLLEVERITKIYLSTDDDEIIDYVTSLAQPKIVLHKRVEALSSSQTSTDQLVAHALDLINEGDILWTHVTSPFLNAQAYDTVITKYYEMLSHGYDSLMTTNLVHGFLWDEVGPINYDRKKEKWPRTQTIKTLYEVNSAVFLASSDIYRRDDDRIGTRPFLYSLNKIQGFDIDWDDDFKLAEVMAHHGLAQV